MFDPALYPADWHAIVLAVRERAGNACEWCGVGNGAIAASGARVVLTTAHLCRCRDAEGRHCGERSHLAALCQRCHLGYDRADHIRVARERRHARRAVADLFPDCRAPLPPRP